MFEKKKIIMLSSDDNSQLGKEIILEKVLFKKNSLSYDKCRPWLPSTEKRQHLYVLSSEIAKEGDWMIDQEVPDDKGNLVTCLYQKRIGFEFANSSTELKVIATTNKILRLPNISDNFITLFIANYNLSKLVTNVLIQYLLNFRVSSNSIVHNLRISSKNNIYINSKSLTYIKY